MDIAKILLFLVSCVFTQNIVFVRLMGAGTLHEKTGSVGVAAIVGVFTALVMTLSAAVNWLIYQKALVALNAQSLELVAFVLVIFAAASLVGRLMKQIVPAAGDALGENYLPLAANCAVLGASMLGTDGGFAQAIGHGFFGGLGFLLAMVLLAGVRERLEFSNVPKSMRGLPIALVSASLIALAFMGFQGL